MKKLLLTCMLAFGFGVNAQILVNESFEGTSLPSGWTSFSNAALTTTRTTYFGTSAGTACAGSKEAYVNTYGTSTSQNWFLIYTSTASNATDLNYSFKYLAKAYSTTTPDVSGTFTVDYSVDGGTTWTNILPTVTFSGAGPVPCTTVSGTIPAGTIPAGANFKLKFSSSAAGGDYYMGIDDVQINQQITSPPACTTVSSPSAGATGVSITPTISWPSVAGAQNYIINLGTTPGGTDILNGQNVGTSTSYSIPSASALLYNTQYYVTVTPSNSIGSATGCTESSFTTLPIPCPSVSQPAAAANGTSVQPTFTWTAVTGATGYYLSIGTVAGGTDILNNQDVGNVTNYTLTSPLNNSTQYFYTLKAYQGGSVSASCSERNFTTSATPPPANDNCSGAIALTVNPDLACGTVTAGNTLGATQSMAAAPCFGNPNDDVWYSFVATSTAHRVSLSNVTSTGTTTGITDMYMQILSGACGTQTSVMCSDPDTAEVTGLTIGETYYVRVYTYSATSTANASFDICVGTPPPPPANDNCSAPTALTVGGVFASNPTTGTTVSASTTTDATATHSCQTTGYADTWYSVVVPASGNVTIETQSATGSSVTDTVMGVYTGSCGALTQIGCSDDEGLGNFSMVSLTGRTPGETLLIGVWNYSSSTSGTFQVSAYDASLGTTETIANTKEVKIYPNPFTDVLNISDIKDVKNVTVVDMAGRVVRTIANPSRQLNLGDLKAGLYILKIDYKDGSANSVKVIKR